MPTTASIARQAPNGGSAENGGQPARPQAVIPFTHAAHEHRERIFDDAFTPGASSHNVAVRDIPAYGYIRHVLLEVEMSGGTLGDGSVTADWPYNLFERIALTDTNGSPIVELDGYALMVMNIVGGYAFNQDPRDVDFDGTINGKFYLRIPVEINHFDAFGAISNQNSASQYQLAIRTRPWADIFNEGTTDVAPEVTVRGWLEAWSLPNEVDALGRPQAQLPPLHGTSQYHTSYTKSVVAGQQTIEFTRVGQLLRAVALIARDSNGDRDATVFPDPYSFKWDGNDIDEQVSQRVHLIGLREKLALSDPEAFDAGVFAFLYNHMDQNKAGDGPPGLWLPSVNSSRIEVVGNVATAGTIQIITNDVAPVEVAPTERYEAPNRTGGINRPSMGNQ